MANIVTYGNSPGFNDSQVILASAARVASPTDIEINNLCSRGLVLIVDVTASAASPSVVVTIKGKDPASGKTYDILASDPFTGGVETRVLRVFPGSLGADANLWANDVLPKKLVISVAHGDADSITYSIGAHFTN